MTTPRKSRSRGPHASESSEEAGCQIGDLFHTLGKTYVLEILHVFLEEGGGPRRFVELQTRLKMSPNTLSDRLKDLVEAGLLSRTPYNEIPPRVDYDATAKTYDLKPVFESLRDWAARHDLHPDPVPAKAAAVVPG